jgi:hypothetical protein
LSVTQTKEIEGKVPEKRKTTIHSVRDSKVIDPKSSRCGRQVKKR